MAISQVAAYAHLSDEDVEALGRELDAIRVNIEDSLGSKDASYIRRTITFQRALDVAARLVIGFSRKRTGWLLGTTALAVAKSIENMEIGHNVGHGQWDWMNDPEIHSTTWEWDMAGASSQWRYSHNYTHHVYTNVLGMDDDMGFGIMRITRDEPWQPKHLAQPLRNFLLAAIFEWGIALHGLHSAHDRAADDSQRSVESKVLAAKVTRQVTKDYLLFPALSGRRWRRTLTANASANLIRNLWAYVVIFCGHFPDGAEKFDPDVLNNESRPEWYLRQMLGTANFDAGRVLAFLSGNLCYQIEHHLFPDLPSNRLSQIAHEVRALCDKYDLPYTTGSLPRQYLLTLRTIHKLAVPDRFLTATSDDAPETASERRFSASTIATLGGASAIGRHGLRTALESARRRRRTAAGWIMARRLRSIGGISACDRSEVASSSIWRIWPVPGQDRSVVMTQQEPRMGVGRHSTPPDYTPRLRLKPKAPRTGYVDGAWWPWSDDLTSELPDLLAVLSVRLGPIERVMYNLGEWAKAPAKAVLGDRTVRLDGYRRQPINTLEVLGANRNRIALLVVPPNTNPDQAHATMMAAAAPDNDSSVDGLLKQSAAEN